MRIIFVISLILFSAVPLASQTAPSPPAFEVASIRLNRVSPDLGIDFKISGTFVRMERYDFVELVMEAYHAKFYQLSLPHDLNTDDHYDLAMRAPGDSAPSREEVRRMLQTLLADRFKLTVHREMKEMPVYALVVGKNGPRFKESAPDAAFTSHHGVNGNNQTLTLVKVTMESLAEEFKNYFMVNRPVIDKTGLTGTYDIKFEATPEFRINRDSDADRISVFTAVQEQLGLKLEPQKAQVEVLVVDHIEKPSEN